MKSRGELDRGTLEDIFELGTTEEGFGGAVVEVKGDEEVRESSVLDAVLLLVNKTNL